MPNEIPFSDVVRELKALDALCKAIAPISGRPATPREDVEVDVTAFSMLHEAFMSNIPENQPPQGSQFFSPSAIKSMQQHREEYVLLLKEFGDKSGRNVAPIISQVCGRVAEVAEEPVASVSVAMRV